MAQESTEIVSSGLPPEWEAILGGAADSASAEQVAEELPDAPADGESPDAVLGLEEQQEETESAEAEGEDTESSEPEVDAEKQKPLEETAEFNKLGKRSQARIRELNDEKKAVRAELESIRAAQAERDAQLQSYMQQVQYQAQLREQQLAAELERYRAEAEAARLAREEEALARKFQGDPVAKFEHEVLKRAKQEADAAAAARVAEIERQLKAQQEAQAKAQADAQRQQRWAKWQQQLDAVVPEQFLKGADPERAKRLADPLKSVLLAYAASAVQEPGEAASEFSKILDDLVELRAKAKAQARGQVVAKNKGLPAGSGAGGKTSASMPEGTVGRRQVTNEMLAKDGRFSSSWEYRQAGSPPLLNQ